MAEHGEGEDILGYDRAWRECVLQGIISHGMAGQGIQGMTGLVTV